MSYLTLKRTLEPCCSDNRSQKENSMNNDLLNFDGNFGDLSDDQMELL